ncbi:MAG: hypothetical protein Q8L98_08720 [Chlamydiales bacterium]|nr:hypothetical protein [Chlamydiales bacterium]
MRIANPSIGSQQQPRQKKEESEQGFLRTTRRMAPVSVLRSLPGFSLPTFTLPLVQATYGAARQVANLTRKFAPIEKFEKARQKQREKLKEEEMKALQSQRELEESFRNTNGLLEAEVLLLETMIANLIATNEAAIALEQTTLEQKKALHESLVQEGEKLQQENVSLNAQLADVSNKIIYHVCR